MGFGFGVVGDVNVAGGFVNSYVTGEVERVGVGGKRRGVGRGAEGAGKQPHLLGRGRGGRHQVDEEHRESHPQGGAACSRPALMVSLCGHGRSLVDLRCEWKFGVDGGTGIVKGTGPGADSPVPGGRSVRCRMG